MPKPMLWLSLRSAIVALAAISALLTPPDISASTMGWAAALVIFLFFPVAMLVAFGVLRVMRGAHFDFQPPTWQANPFNFSHPEHLFHLGAFASLAAGSVALARAVVASQTITPELVAPVAMGLGVLVGLYALTLVHHRQANNGI